jgi:ATP-dependent Lhr-like helicase
VSAPSAAYERLHPKLQRWMYHQRWKELRPIQEAAVAPVLAGECDVILAAATAGGKTEAAFLPILTSLAEEPIDGSVGALCVSPLKALINDQFQRLETLGEPVDVAVHRWHGDVAAARKKRFLASPSGVLLITPESLEAMCVLRGQRLPVIFAELRYVVVDELHAFIGSERGRQLQSLLHRLELALRRRVPRVALSATLGDLGLAADFLRPGEGAGVVRIEDREGGQEVRLQLRGYRQRPVGFAAGMEDGGAATDTNPDAGTGGALEIARDLFNRLRGGHHLVFANQRAVVERYADLFRRLCEAARVPNEFWPHHGSLSKELREEAERAINDPGRPTTLVATTTLELGIDVGAIESIAQIGAPPSVAALRQRLGRSGRQGGPAVLRLSVQEHEVTPEAPPAVALHPELVETTAMLELLISGWVEPPPPAALHLSTLVQQVLSLVAQHGGTNARTAWRALCSSGPFVTVDPQLFEALLRSLGAADLILQDHQGELVLGLQGERLVDHYSFYAAFSSPEEYRLVSGGKTLGQLPISYAVFPDLLLIFGGRRWRVLDVDDERKVIDLVPAKGGRTPAFVGTGGPLVHDRVREEMFALYGAGRVPRYLDSTARELLDEARTWFGRLDLGRRSLLGHGESTLVFPWKGDRTVGTLALLFAGAGFEVSQGGFFLEVERTVPKEVFEAMRELARGPLPSPRELTERARNLQREKFHPYLAKPLLVADYAASHLDLSGAAASLAQMLDREKGRAP